MLNWNEYVKQGIVRRTSLNKGRIKTLLQMVQSRLDMIAKIETNEQNASVVFTNYYDALREVCEALALSKGYKIYLHESIGLFMREILKENVIFIKFDRFRQMRNGVNYYGIPVSFKETIQAIKEIKEIISKLKLKHLKEFLE